MLSRIREFAVIALLLSAAGFFVCGGLFLWQMRAAAASLRIAVEKYGEGAGQLSVALQTVNRPCSGSSCGTLAGIGNVLATVNDDAEQLHETMGTINAQVSGIGREITRPCKGEAGPDTCGLLAQSRKTVVKVGDAVVTTQVRIRDSQKLMDTASSTLASAAHDLDQMAGAGSAAFTDLDGVVRSKTVQQSMEHGEAISAHLDAMTGDTAAWLHNYLDPPPCRANRFVCGVAHTWAGIKVGARLTEPLYWGLRIGGAVN